MPHYLDYAASAPLRPGAGEAWCAAGGGGNPASAHAAGRTARRRLDEAREAIAAACGAQPAEVVLTSGGTEADGLALTGLFLARQADAARPYVVVGAVEHPAVSQTAALLEARHGARVVELPVAADGVAHVDALRDHLARHADETALVALMGANNETGAVQPFRAAAELAAAHGVPAHADLVQLAGRAPLDFGATPLATAAISAHKLGGPVGVGALLAARRAPLVPLAGGGGQERGLRSGTVDVRGACAFAAAATEAAATVEAEGARLERLLEPWDALVASGTLGLVARTPLQAGAHVPGLRLVTVPGAAADVLTYLLDRAGVQVSAGSACHAGVAGPSAVLLAMGLGPREAASGLRVSLGWASTAADVAALVEALPAAVATARAAGERLGGGSRARFAAPAAASRHQSRDVGEIGEVPDETGGVA